MKSPRPFLHVNLLILFAFLCLIPFTAQSQADSSFAYLDSLTLLIEQEKQGSLRQQELAADLRQRLFDHLKESPTLAQRDLIWRTLNNISRKEGRYVVLNRFTQPDTLSAEVLACELRLQKLQDSILIVQQQLMTILETPNSQSTKERAVNTLVKIHKTEVVKYLWDREEEFRFGPFDSESFDEETYRSVMLGFFTEYFGPESGQEKWILFPAFLESLQDIGLMELGLLMYFFSQPQEYHAPWLLVDFILANTANLSAEQVDELSGYLKQYRERD